jgi:SAM-dependent methyltransferase
MSEAAQYEGVRILEAMHEAVRYNASLFDLIKKTRPAGAQRILEFGAGDGVFIGKFRNDGIAVEGVERDAKLRGLLEDRFGCRTYRDIREVDTDSVDFVYSMNVLEHIEDLDSELLELRRVLRRAGCLFAFVPAFEMLWTSLDDEVGHVTRFTRASLTSALRRGGFDIAQMEYFDCLGFPAALGVRLMEKLNMFRYQPESVRFYDRRIFPSSRYLDRFFQHTLGKNLFAVARKTSA